MALSLPGLGRGQNYPKVTRIEPPNWWVGLKPDPMLLLTGENLVGAEVASSARGLRVARVDVPAGGRYAFVWLEIGSDARPGDASFTVRTPMGSASASWSLAPRRAAPGNFQGLGPDDVIYLIMPDRFANGDPTNDEPPQSPGTHDRSNPRAYHGGDLRGIRQHLDYLRDLGVNTLWINPIYDNSNRTGRDYHGYGAVDFYAVDEHLGTLKEFQQLVADAHARGMKLLLDVVVNHSGPDHDWVRNSPGADWLHGTREKHLVARSSFEGLIDPHAPPHLWRDVVEGWFAGILPDLNTENPRVAQYLVGNNLWWVEMSGLDGFRLDTFPYVSRRFWSDWHRVLFAAYPRFVTIGEVFHSDPAITSFFAGGRAQYDGVDSGVTTVFDFPLYQALRDVIVRGAPSKRIVDVLERDSLYPHPERLVTFFGNHDVTRFMTASGGSKEKLKLAFSLLFTLRGIPQIYSGDEIGMPGGEDPDNRRDFPGGWPDDPRNAFTAAGRTPDEQDIFAHVQMLLRLRREHPALRRGRQWHLAWNDTTYAFLRETKEERLLVAFNNSDAQRTLRVPRKDTPIADAHSLEPLFAALPSELYDAEVSIPVAARSAAIYLVK